MVRCRGVLSRIEYRIKELNGCYIRFIDERKIKSHLGERDQFDDTSCNELDAVHTQLTSLMSLK